MTHKQVLRFWIVNNDIIAYKAQIVSHQTITQEKDVLYCPKNKSTIIKQQLILNAPIYIQLCHITNRKQTIQN